MNSVLGLLSFTRENSFMQLLIHAKGATDHDLQRGSAAAQRVFERAGVSAIDCALASSQAKAGSLTGSIPSEKADELRRLAGLWNEAERAGIEACCRQMMSTPHDSCLELRFGDSTRPKAIAPAPGALDFHGFDLRHSQGATGFASTHSPRCADRASS